MRKNTTFSKIHKMIIIWQIAFYLKKKIVSYRLRADSATPASKSCYYNVLYVLYDLKVAPNGQAQIQLLRFNLSCCCSFVLKFKQKIKHNKVYNICKMYTNPFR